MVFRVVPSIFFALFFFRVETAAARITVHRHSLTTRTYGIRAHTHTHAHTRTHTHTHIHTHTEREREREREREYGAEEETAKVKGE